MGAVRINITLPEEIVKKLNKMTKQRERSAYIAKALAFYEKHHDSKKVVAEMVEGYIKTYEESLSVNSDFDDVLGDGDESE